MKVILREEVKALGKVGEVVSVSGGYARNYLLPRGFALEATPGTVRLADSFKKRVERQKAKQVAEAEALALLVGKVSLTFERLAGENDKLFGSVTSSDIAEGLAQQGAVVDKRKIELEAPIDRLGVFEVPVRLAAGISATVKVWVAAAKKS